MSESQKLLDKLERKDKRRTAKGKQGTDTELEWAHSEWPRRPCGGRDHARHQEPSVGHSFESSWSGKVAHWA